MRNLGGNANIRRCRPTCLPALIHHVATSKEASLDESHVRTSNSAFS
jgi:hypothetical protein